MSPVEYAMIAKLVIGLCLLLAVVVAWASTPALHMETDPAQPAYQSLDDAAVAAVRASFAKDPRSELTGVIFRDRGGAYHYTLPVGNGASSEVWGVEVIRIPAGSVIVGDYHTHPVSLSGEDLGQYFSETDIDDYRASHWTGYVGVGKTRQVLRWDGKTHIETMGGRLLTVGDGTVVGTL